MRYEQLPDGRIVPVKRHPMRGLGDMVAQVAAPIANVLGIQNCDACAQRQALMNSMFPFRGRR